MDQQKSSTKSKNTILKYLPRATSSVVSFQNPPMIYSPSKDKRLSDKPHKSNLGIGFSGPLVSMIPAETRRKIKNNSDYTSVYEPTSPTVSCMGQVKCKYQKQKPKPSGDKVFRLTSSTQNAKDDQDLASKSENKTKKKTGFKKIFSGASPSGGKKRDAGNRASPAPLNLDKVTPSLGAMKRFSSGRGKFSSIDWTKEVAEAMDSGDRRYDSDEESDDEHVIVPSSAPVMIRNSLGFDDKFIRVAGINTEPKKEINLWKRRTMTQPKPLQLHKI